MIRAYEPGDHMGPPKRAMASVVGLRAICEVNSSLLAPCLDQEVNGTYIGLPSANDPRATMLRAYEPGDHMGPAKCPMPLVVGRKGRCELMKISFEKGLLRPKIFWLRGPTMVGVQGA